MTSLPISFDHRVHAAVREHRFPLLFATVSGARLYGFPSPDSDYDLRGVLGETGAGGPAGAAAARQPLSPVRRPGHPRAARKP